MVFLFVSVVVVNGIKPLLHLLTLSANCIEKESELTIVISEISESLKRRERERGREGEGEGGGDRGGWGEGGRKSE